jgi:hypothetical protein
MDSPKRRSGTPIEGVAMSQVTIKCKRQLVAAAAAIGMVGSFTAAPPSHAGPLAPLPLAPGCDQYVFPGVFRVKGTPKNFIEGDARWEVSFGSTGTSAGTGPATVIFNDGGRVDGRVIEGFIRGNTIEFRILWDNDTAWDFWGGISDDGKARGGERLVGGEPKDADWYSITPLACATPAAPPASAQQPAPPQKKTATVTSDVDVYNIAHDDVESGDGVVGAKVGMLRAGQQVEYEPSGTATCTPNEWCKVFAPGLPGGFGFVRGHLQF